MIGFVVRYRLCTFHASILNLRIIISSRPSPTPPSFPPPVCMSVRVHVDSVDGPGSSVVQSAHSGVTAGGLGWHVEVPQKSLPTAVAAAIKEAVATAWRSELAVHATDGEAGVQDWRLEAMFAWAEQQYSMLLGMVPECIDVYEGRSKSPSQPRSNPAATSRRGDLRLSLSADARAPDDVIALEGCNSAGATCRRYTLVDAETDDGADDSAAAAGGAAAAAEPAVSPEEQARRDAIVAKKRAEREEAALQKAREKDADAQRKRQMAEDGLAEFKHVQLSKKEQEERSKSKQGVRTSKTGPRRKACVKIIKKESRCGSLLLSHFADVRALLVTSSHSKVRRARV